MAAGAIFALAVLGRAFCGEDAHERAVRLSEPSASTTPAAPQPPQIVTRKLGEILEQDKGQRVCTCGYVQSSTRPRGDVRIGTIYLLPKKRLPRDDEVMPTVICWWGDDDPAPVVRQWQPVCAVGRYEPPTLQNCQVVDKCP